jgi:hypothetical protein
VPELYESQAFASNKWERIEKGQRLLLTLSKSLFFGEIVLFITGGGNLIAGHFGPQNMNKLTFCVFCA